MKKGHPRARVVSEDIPGGDNLGIERKSTAYRRTRLTCEPLGGTRHKRTHTKRFL
jgi:hypothetical protein